jgi:hypothetical protein
MQSSQRHGSDQSETGKRANSDSEPAEHSSRRPSVFGGGEHMTPLVNR